MSRVRYFAYGSNMLTARLKRRCPSAVAVTTAAARCFSVGFHKRGMDDSGKATLLAEDQALVPALGAVFELDAHELTDLDRAEGSGYRRVDGFSVHCTRTGECLETSTYIAIERHDSLVPFDWYLALMLAGIAEHGLGKVHAGRLRAQDFARDEQLHRASRAEALHAFRVAGIDDYYSLLGETGAV